MAFRDLLAGVEEVDDEISVNHDMLEHSASIGHKAVMFNRIEGTGGLRSALNVLPEIDCAQFSKSLPENSSISLHGQWKILLIP